MGDAIRWLTAQDAADRACCGAQTTRRAMRSGRLQAARIGGRGESKFLQNWIDEWLLSQVMPEDLAIDVAVEAAPSLLHEFSWP